MADRTTQAPARPDLDPTLAMRGAWKDSGQLPDQMIKESHGVVIRAADEEEMRRTRTIDFIVSTPTPDRVGDVVVPTGGRFENFRKSPVILWAHSHYTLPLGSGSNVRADASGVYMSKTFVEREINPLADSVFELLIRKILNACSIGFRPIKWAWAEDRGNWAIDYYEWELLESSICAVGMNPDALQVARSMGVNMAPIADFLERSLDELLTQDDEQARRLQERLIKAASSKGAQVQKPKNVVSDLMIKVGMDDGLTKALDDLERRLGVIEQIEGRLGVIEQAFERFEVKALAAGGGQNNKADEQGEKMPSDAKTAADPSDGVILILEK